jgi:hypothetical protein
MILYWFAQQRHGRPAGRPDLFSSGNEVELSVGRASDGVALRLSRTSVGPAG